MNRESCRPLPIKKNHTLSLVERISAESSGAYIFEKVKQLEENVNTKNLIVESNKNYVIFHYIIKYITT